jgi:hypothetical protein
MLIFGSAYMQRKLSKFVGICSRTNTLAKLVRAAT